MDKNVVLELSHPWPQNNETENKMEKHLGDHSMLNSSVCELSDEEISTKKENHVRLGPEDLNDTLLYDF